MPELRTARDAWVAEGLRTMAAEGVDAVRVERLARALGVTKGGFYGYFANRAVLLEEMLDAWEKVLLLEPMATVDADPGDGRTRLRRLFGLALAAGPDLLAVELAVRDWSRYDAAVAERVARVDDRRTAYLRDLFADFCDDPADVEGRCLLVSTLFIGNGFVATRHPNRTRAEAIRSALEHLLL